MNWLKKVGSIILHVVGVIDNVSHLPLLTNVIPATSVPGQVLSDVSDVADIIITTEQMFAAAYGSDAHLGSDKLRAAVPFVAQILQHAKFMEGRAVKDTAKFQTAVSGITSNFADLLSSLGD